MNRMVALHSSNGESNPMDDAPPYYRCPKCDLPLTTVRTGKGVSWICAGCNGRAITLELLRRTFETDAINALWRHTVEANNATGQRNCPSCHRKMLVVPLTDTNSALIDICKACHFVWFDDHEIDNLHSRPTSTDSATRSGYDPGALVDPSWINVIGHFLKV